MSEGHGAVLTSGPMLDRNWLMAWRTSDRSFLSSVASMSTVEFVSMSMR